jgi:lipopolysaccharide transport system permease protein
MAVGQERAAVFKSLLGNCWLLLAPALQIAIYFVLVVVIFKSGAAPRTTFMALSLGILHYSLLGNAAAQCQPAIHGNASLLLQIRLEPFLLIWVGYLRALRQWFAALVVFYCLYAFLGPTPSVSILAYPAVVLLWATLCWSAGLWMAQLTVFLRDLEKFVPICLQLLMYSAPVIYPVSFYPESWRTLAVTCNPVAAAFALFRWSLLDEPCPVELCIASLTLWTAGSLWLAHVAYGSLNRRFTKVI